MTPVTPLLVYLLVSIAFTSTHMLLTLLLASTMSSVIKVLHLMTQVCSIAHTFLSRWFVPSVRTPSKKSDSRLATASLRTHLPKEPTRLKQVVLRVMPTPTIRELSSITSCDLFHIKMQEDLRVLFFCLNKK